MRRNDAQKFVAEKLGVELNSRVRAAVNDRMTERGCASVYWKGFKVFRGVNLKGLQPWRTKKPHRHLRAV